MQSFGVSWQCCLIDGCFTNNFFRHIIDALGAPFVPLWYLTAIKDKVKPETMTTLIHWYHDFCLQYPYHLGPGSLQISKFTHFGTLQVLLEEGKILAWLDESLVPLGLVFTNLTNQQLIELLATFPFNHPKVESITFRMVNESINPEAFNLLLTMIPNLDHLKILGLSIHIEETEILQLLSVACAHASLMRVEVNTVTLSKGDLALQMLQENSTLAHFGALISPQNLIERILGEFSLLRNVL